MVANRRNFIFRVSIVINIAVLLYAAMHLSGTTSPGNEWTASFTVEGSDRMADARYITRDEFRNLTETRLVDSSIRNLDESTSQKTPSTMPTTNKTTSSTTSISEVEKKLRDTSPGDEDILEIVDENFLSDATLARLKFMLRCNNRDFIPEYVQRGEYWVLKNYVRADRSTLLCHESVTYTTHAGFEFLDNVQPLVERWLAPISLAIHAPGADLQPTINSIRYLRTCLGHELVKQFVTFHIFFSNKHVPSKIPDPDMFLAVPYNCSLPPPYQTFNMSATYMKKKNLLYPVNVARNIARDSALTHFILPSDIELYPSPNLVPRFLNMIARNGKPLNITTKPRVFPISIFEVDAKVKVPSTKTELQKMLKSKTAIPFHKYVCPDCHNIPQRQQWISATETNQMDVFHVGKRRGSFVHWEPIFIGTHSDPHYDDRLSWEGKKDKMTQGYILCVKDYDFMILNNAFLTHKPGIKHYVKNAKRDAIVAKQNSYVSNVIMPELKKLFGTRPGCSL